MAGEVTEEAVTGEVAAVAAPVKIPDELKAEFDAYADRAAKAAAVKTEKAIRAELAEQQRLASLSESDRTKAETDSLKAKVAMLEGAQKFSALERRVTSVASSLGFVIPEVLSAELQAAVESGEEVDESAVARRAFDRSTGYLGAAKSKPMNASARTGTPAGAADPANFSTMTAEQVVAHARSLGGARANKYLADSQVFLARGGQLIDS